VLFCVFVMTLVQYSDQTKKELEAFASGKETEISSSLISVIENISLTGATCYGWATLKVLLSARLQECLNQSQQRYKEEKRRLNSENQESNPTTPNKQRQESEQADELSFQERKQRFFVTLEGYEEAPFTLQRLAELALQPEKTYARPSKYLSALEKMVSISTTISPLTQEEARVFNNNILAPPATTSTASTPTTSSSQSTPQNNATTSDDINNNIVQGTEDFTSTFATRQVPQTHTTHLPEFSHTTTEPSQHAISPLATNSFTTTSVTNDDDNDNEGDPMEVM